MIDFLGELCACVKRVDANIKTTVVLLPLDLSLVEELTTLPALDTIGCHLFWNLLNESVCQVQAWGHTLVETTRQSQKRNQLWLQNFSLDEETEKEMEAAFQHIINVEPDGIGCYYYWRNNADPTRVWDKTRTLLRRIPRRQLHWHITQPDLKVI